MHEALFDPILDQHSAHLVRLTGSQDFRRSAYTRYLSELWQENERYNLVSRKMSPEALVENHLLDCMLGLPFLPAAKNVADLGSGGGLPAAVIAIARPDCRVHCFEKSPVKCQFLAGLAEWLPNLKVHGPIPAGQHLGIQVDWITARAFKPIPVILELTRKHFQKDTPYYLFKARAAKIAEEAEAARLTADQMALVVLEAVGAPCERHMVKVRKGGWA